MLAQGERNTDSLKAVHWNGLVSRKNLDMFDGMHPNRLRGEYHNRMENNFTPSDRDANQGQMYLLVLPKTVVDIGNHLRDDLQPVLLYLAIQIVVTL